MVTIYCCSVGPKGEGGLDDATGAGGAGGASMKQSSGVVDLGMYVTPCQQTRHIAPNLKQLQFTCLSVCGGGLRCFLHWALECLLYHADACNAFQGMFNEMRARKPGAWA